MLIVWVDQKIKERKTHTHTHTHTERNQSKLKQRKKHEAKKQREHTESKTVDPFLSTQKCKKEKYVVARDFEGQTDRQYCAQKTRVGSYPSLWKDSS